MSLMTGWINPLAFLKLDLPPAPDSPDLPNAQDGIVRLIRLDPKNLQSRTIRLQVDATRPGRRLGLV